MRPHTLQRAIYSLAALVCLILPLQLLAQSLSIIPAPSVIERGTGEFELKNGTTIYASGHERLKDVEAYLRTKLSKPTGFNIAPAASKASAAILLLINERKDISIGEEGYILFISDTKVEISANSPAGVFYGVQSFLQCLPTGIESDSIAKGTHWTAPSLTIKDYPRFAWRGIMLDVSRHFFSKEYVKEYIDQIARYKYNRLHLHLTDDNGWRIEIKSLPRLTSVGAWRVPRTGTFGSNAPPRPGEKETYGGYYTQDDIREIVAYAKSRFIEILPEIDVPGHSMAAIAAYPYLCVTRDTTIRVNPGSDFSDWFSGGKFVMHIDNTLNPTDEKVYEFLDKVVTEVAALFPFEYIHMGGDECYTGYWEKDPKVQAFMKKNKLNDGHALQAYFTARVNKIVRAKNKKMIGWDEILHGQLSQDAAVMSWQGTKGGIEASKKKHTVVMSPAPEFYLDMGQGEPSIEPPIYNSARLKEVYHFNILPPGTDSTYVIGGQGNLWTEQIPTTAQLEYMTYPRAFAISETLWSPKSRKNWEDFIIRTEGHFNRLNYARINYATSLYDPIVNVSKNEAGNLVISLVAEVPELDLYYTLDNAVPNHYHPSYKGPIELSADVDNFRVIAYRNGKPVGRLITLKREDLAKRVKKNK